MRHQSKHVTLLAIVLIEMVTICGCGERRDADRPSVFREQDNQYVAVIVIDLSGSFSDKMANDGKAYQFAVQVLDHYFRRRDALSDRIILAQISGTERSLMWEGSPLELRRDFPSAESFRDFLLKQADGSGSLVNDGLANVMEYVTSHPQHGNGRAKSAVLVLSDMDDTGGNSNAEQRLMRSLSTYGQQNGSVGIYFCNQLGVGKWKERLGQSGIRNYVVESEIVGKPKLPSFD